MLFYLLIKALSVQQKIINIQQLLVTYIKWLETIEVLNSRIKVLLRLHKGYSEALNLLLYQNFADLVSQKQ